MKVTLYIAGIPADINGDSLILFTYTAEETNNPTIIKNSYSQTITLPGTPTNNAIFGSYFRPDRRTSAEQGIIAGASYNALKRLPFAIRNERNEVLESGYLKLNSVQRTGEQVHSYSVSLYGGLGDFFYSLMYNDDGSKRTLADLAYPLGSGEIVPSETEMEISAATVKEAWDALAAGTTGNNLWQILNFAPAYNGIPDKNFAADKALCYIDDGSTRFVNITNRRESGSYVVHPDVTHNAALLQMGNKHTEWEMGDLRCWMQRPVLRVKALLKAFELAANSAGYTFTLDSSIFSSTNRWYESAWLTLPLISRETIPDLSSLTLADLLAGTASPAEYLISYAKMFALSFIVDGSTNTIRLTSRNKYYAEQAAERIDLTGRIDRSREIELTPLNIGTKYYLMQSEMYGQRAEGYEAQYARRYGSQMIDTGYEFELNPSELFDGNVFKGAVDVLEASPYYFDNAKALTKQGAPSMYYFRIAKYESVKYRLYTIKSATSSEDGGLESKDFDPEVWEEWDGRGSLLRYWNPDYEGSDIFAKPQLHGEDNAAQDGANVLLFFCGMQSIQKGGEYDAATKIYLSDDDTYNEGILNEGEHCWIATANGAYVTMLSELPSFRRSYVQGSTMSKSFDFGNPREVYDPQTEFVPGLGIYDSVWASYLADKFDADTKVLRAWVNLRGLRVDATLLRRFFYYDNCLWVLSKIDAHSVTTDDLTQCEFVKVQDALAYTTGQDYTAQQVHYIRVSPTTATLIANSGANTTISVESNTGWTVQGLPSWLSASKTSGSGNDTVVLTATANPSTARTATVRFVIEGQTASVGVTQQESTDEWYDFTNVSVVYSSGSALDAAGSNYARIKADIRHWRGVTLIGTQTNQYLTPVKQSGDSALYVSGTQIKAPGRGTTAGSARSATFVGTYQGYNTDALTVTQEINEIVDYTVWYGDYVLTCSDMSEVSRLGETRTLYAESNRHRTVYYTSGESEVQYQQHTSYPSTNLATGLPSSITGNKTFTARFPANTGGSRSIWIELGDKRLTWTQAAGLSAEVDVYAGTLESDTATQKAIRMWYEGDGYTGSVILSNVVVELEKIFNSTGRSTRTDYTIGSITLMNGQTLDTGEILPELQAGNSYKLRVKSATVVSPNVNCSYPVFDVPFNPFPVPTITELYTDTDGRLVKARYSINPDPATEAYKVRIFARIYRNGVFQESGYGYYETGKNIGGTSPGIVPNINVRALLDDAGKLPFTPTEYTAYVIMIAAKTVDGTTVPQTQSQEESITFTLIP